MVTQPGDPKNKSKPAYKKYCTYCHKNNHGVSNCYQKQEYQKYRNPRPRTGNKTEYSSRDNDRNRYSQNYSYHNDRYRNNDRYRSNSTDYLILDQDIDLVLNHKEIPLGDIIIHIDLHPNQEITDHDLEHLHRTDNKTESIK